MTAVYDLFIDESGNESTFLIRWYNKDNGEEFSFEQTMKNITTGEVERLWLFPEHQLPIGNKLFDFLDGKEGYLRHALHKAKQQGEFPVIRLFACKKVTDWPFELLALDNDFLVPHCLHLVRSVQCLSSWRVEKNTILANPLKILFMACSPQDQELELEYEREEEAIFNITENLSVDIEVEDLGSLASLRGQLELNHYNVIHLSGHTAMMDDQPYFIMEQETGYHHMVSPEKLWDEALIENPPRVLFLSGNGATVSFARQMVEKHPVPMVLGWGHPVGDEQIIHSVKRFYHQLSKGETILNAVQRVRGELIKGFGMSPPSAWPLLRLFSSDPVLSALVTKGRLKQPKPRHMKHIFLKQSQVIVLEEGFVGRRRQLQQSIAALKQNFDKVGVLLLGAMGLGKSCLAGKICERFPYHTLIIIQGKFNAITLEAALKDAFIHSQDSMGKALLKEKRSMEDKLADLCSTCFKEKNYLLLLDNFEQNLENWDEDRPGPLLPEAVELLKVLLYYLPGSGKMTQMLITCRYRFSLISQGIDLLANRLEHIWLTSFQPHEQRKKARGLKHIYKYPDPGIGKKLLSAGCGNPSLMEWINRLVGELSETELPELLTAVENQKESFISDHVIGELLNRSSKQLASFLYCFSIYRMPISMEGVRLVGEKACLVEWNELLVQGVNLGLVEYHQPHDSYMVTPLLREKLLTRLDSNHLQQSHRAAFIFFSNRCASVEEIEPGMLEELIFHALGCGETETAARQGTRLVNYLRECLALRESRRVGEWIWAENAGKNRTEADILLLSQLANTISDMGEHSRAISCFEQVLNFWRGRYGEKHNETASALNNLGTAFYTLKDHTKAISYFEQALDIWKRVYGQDHPQVAAVMNNLGSVWDDTGNHQKAIDYYQQALKIDEAVFGRQHAKVATRLNNLGSAWKALDNYQKATEYFQQALDIYKAVLGEEHHQTAAALNNLGSVWMALEEHGKAIDYFLQALAIDEALFGRQHSKVATRLNNLGTVYFALQQKQKAKSYFEQAYPIFKQSLGSEHPDTQAAKKWLDACIQE